MTYEEKAEDYIESLTDDYFENTPKHEIVKNAFVTGIFFTESQLKKDKEYLDNINNEQTEVILQFNEQIEQLSNDNRVLRTALFTQKIQVEKMKCCGNCKHYKQTSNYLVGTCKGKHNIEGDNICNMWELAE